MYLTYDFVHLIGTKYGHTMQYDDAIQKIVQT